MSNTNLLNPFHIEVAVYNTFLSLETSLYKELKKNEYSPNLEELFEYYKDFNKIEESMRIFNDEFKGKPLEEFIQINAGKIECVVLDCTHRVELLSYVGCIQLILMAILNNPQYQHKFTVLLISIMNQYLYRGDPVPAYWHWHLQNSSYH